MILAFAFLFLQAPAAPDPAALVEDVRALTVATTNEQRFEAVTALLRARKIPFTVEPFTVDKPARNDARTQGRNIIVTLGQGVEDLVIGAHYDAVYLKDGALSRGAVDNAASSVMLVHLAEALRDQNLPLRVRIVWFDMEELGLIGSTRFVEAHRADRVTAMLNFDINAYGDTVMFGVPPGGESAELRRAVMLTCAAEQTDCIRLNSLPTSDDRPFGKAGIPTLSLAVLPALEAHQVWLMFQGGGAQQGPPPAILTTIHTAQDVIEKVDGATIAKMQRFAMALVRNVVALATNAGR